MTLGVAESCTGGRVADLLTDVPGASRFFLGGVVSYTNDVKVNVLRVSREVLAREKAVSLAVVGQMAEGIRAVTRASIALAVVGYAGPDADPSGHAPVGTVHVAVAGRVEAARSAILSGTRRQVKTGAAAMALRLVLDTLDDLPLEARG